MYSIRNAPTVTVQQLKLVLPSLFIKDGAGNILFVARTGVRSIANQDALIMELARIDSFGVGGVEVHTGTEPFLDQVQMFVQAKVVVGSHGAGLSNTVFCQPGTPVVILPMKPHVDHTFGHLASSMGLQQWLVPPVSSPYYATFGTLSQKQIELVIQAVTESLAFLANRHAAAAQDTQEQRHGEL
eukprot:m.48047 g.48047  ORF g.48047 m.48047 type:complete len:185 (+) comp11965_c0_seq1:584-1138(+)